LAKKVIPKNGNGRLEEALALLIQNEAAFVARLSESDQRHAEIERQHLEFKRLDLEYRRQTNKRFARIEAQMAEIIRVLAEHGRILERLPEAVRDKIGFKTQE
jgi:hypothetical protein